MVIFSCRQEGIILSIQFSETRDEFPYSSHCPSLLSRPDSDILEITLARRSPGRLSLVELQKRPQNHVQISLSLSVLRRYLLNPEYLREVCIPRLLLVLRICAAKSASSRAGSVNDAIFSFLNANALGELLHVAFSNYGVKERTNLIAATGAERQRTTSGVWSNHFRSRSPTLRPG